MSNAKPSVIFLMGPTASGKTDLAMALCQHLPLDIVSVDSAMIYRGMDIGTAKPSSAALKSCPHRLIDIRDPAEHYSVANFCEDAKREITDIHGNNRVPLLVGGSMMYFRALLDGLADMPSISTEVRAAIEAEAKIHGWPVMHQKLMSLDPEYGRQLHPNHSQRISRALEVYRQSGRTMTYWRQQGSERDLTANFNVIQLALLPENRQWLHRRIECRFQQMLQQGLVEEVQKFRRRPDIHIDLPAMRCVGYRQVWQYLDSLEDNSLLLNEKYLLEKGAAATRQLAKRQITWLKTWAADLVFEPDFTNFKKNLIKILNFLTLDSI